VFVTQANLLTSPHLTHTHAHAGSLNQFGGGIFCDFFIQLWTKEGFPNYTDVARSSAASGMDVLKKILEATSKEAGDAAGADAAAGEGEGEGAGEEKEEEEGAKSAEEAAVVGKIGTVVLHGFLLAALFRTRPELAELVHLELVGRKDEMRDI